jgi:hypothetical protein
MAGAGAEGTPKRCTAKGVVGVSQGGTRSMVKVVVAVDILQL